MTVVSRHSQMNASLGIEVDNGVIQELIIVQAAEVMLSQLHNIKFPSRWVHTPHILHHSHQPKRRLVADTNFANEDVTRSNVQVCYFGRHSMHGQNICCWRV